MRPGERNPRSRTRRSPAVSEETDRWFEAAIATGLESVAVDEIRWKFGTRARLIPARESPAGILRFNYGGRLQPLLQFKTVLAVYLLRRFPVPRPRALLGEEHLRALLADIRLVRGLCPPNAYSTLTISAAGADTPVLQRLKAELSERTGLAVADPDTAATPRGSTSEGDLQIRLRRPWEGDEGWDALIRLSPRPLSTRAWRVCNREGALNATVAHAMALMTRPRPHDLFLNLACGSGTLLVERLSCGPAARLIGCDISEEALGCARENLRAAGCESAVELQDWDAQALPLPDTSVDALCADLPFGHLTGSHRENARLYPAILREAARVARPGARFILITSEPRRTERWLAELESWSIDATFPVGLGGLQPTIFCLRRL